MRTSLSTGAEKDKIRRLLVTLSSSLTGLTIMFFMD